MLHFHCTCSIDNHLASGLDVAITRLSIVSMQTVTTWTALEWVVVVVLIMVL